MRTYLTRYELDAPRKGRIHSRVECHASDWLVNADLYPDLGALPQDCDPDADYVDLEGIPVVQPRPALAGFDKLEIVADGEDAATLAAPVPFVATIDGEPYDVAEPNSAGVYTLAVAVDVAATYSVRVEAWPFLPYEAEITAT